LRLASVNLPIAAPAARLARRTLRRAAWPRYPSRRARPGRHRAASRPRPPGHARLAEQPGRRLL